MKSFTNIAEGLFFTILYLVGLYMVLCFLHALIFGKWESSIFSTNKLFVWIFIFSVFYALRNLISRIKDSE